MHFVHILAYTAFAKKGLDYPGPNWPPAVILLT
jgi:hypothetical protein